MGGNPRSSNPLLEHAPEWLQRGVHGQSEETIAPFASSAWHVGDRVSIEPQAYQVRRSESPASAPRLLTELSEWSTGLRRVRPLSGPMSEIEFSARSKDSSAVSPPNGPDLTDCIATEVQVREIGQSA